MGTNLALAELPASEGRTAFQPAFDDVEASWPAVSRVLRTRVPESTYQLWLAPLKPLALRGGQLLLEAPDTILNWVGDRFGPLIEEVVADLVGAEIGLRIIASAGGHDQLAGERQGGSASVVSTRAPRVRKPDRSAHPDPCTAPTKQLPDPRFTFDQFIIGENNRLAHAASLAVAETPGQSYNPLFIYGPTGLGKTHLMKAIANYCYKFHPDLGVVYATVESFTNQYITSLQAGNISSFKDRYRSAQILLLDDIHVLEGKERTQEEFFHTFNALHASGSQLVLSSDRRPKELTRIESRLRSRFELGLTVDIKPPDLKTRVAILRKRAAIDGVSIKDSELFQCLATNVAGNIRSLEGALVRTVAFASLKGTAPSVELAREVVASLHGSKLSDACSIDDVKQAVCQEFDVSESDLRCASRAGKFSYPRHLAMFLSRELTGSSLPQIAREFDRKDHTTVLSASRKIAALAASETRTGDVVLKLKNRLRQHSTAVHA